MTSMNASVSPGVRSLTSRLALWLNPLFRNAILIATSNGVVTRTVRRYGMRLGGSRFVVGETLDDCLVALKKLNAKGLRVNTTILGEGIHDAATADAVTSAYVNVLDRLAAEHIDGNIAVKLTHLGLNIGEDIAWQNIERLARHAATHSMSIRIDMEESAHADGTLRIYRQLRDAGHDNIGTVLQAYLFRTEQDLTDLLPLDPNLRLVKGAYLEPDTIAFAKKSDVDENYLQLAERMLAGDGFTAIATHDERIIAHVTEVAERQAIPKDRFEFQMLYGIRPQLQLELVSQGYRVLVATPYGPDWYQYLMRRLAERPANVLFFTRNLLRR